MLMSLILFCVCIVYSVTGIFFTYWCVKQEFYFFTIFFCFYTNTQLKKKSQKSIEN